MTDRFGSSNTSGLAAKRGSSHSKGAGISDPCGAMWSPEPGRPSAVAPPERLERAELEGDRIRNGTFEQNGNALSSANEYVLSGSPWLLGDMGRVSAGLLGLGLT